MTESDPITRLNAALEGRYRVERELGKGGMATVYLADDIKHERKVALKVLKQELAAVVGAKRFLAEIKTTANLQHPHILPPPMAVGRSSYKARRVILLGLALAAFASQPTVANGQQAAPDSVFVGDERSAVLSGVLEYIPMVGFAYAGDWKRGLLPNAFRVASFIGFAATADFLSPSCSAACSVSGFAMVATSVWAVVGAVNTARDHNKAARVPRSSLSVAPAPYTNRASAMQAMKVGQHVRVDVSQIGRVEGRFLVANGTTLTLARDDVPIQIRLPDIERLWVRGRATRKGAFIGAGVGVLVGIVGGLLISSVACEPIDGGDCTAAEVAAVTGLLGGAGGAVVGYFAIPSWRLRFP